MPGLVGRLGSATAPRAPRSTPLFHPTFYVPRGAPEGRSRSPVRPNRSTKFFKQQVSVENADPFPACLERRQIYGDR